MVVKNMKNCLGFSHALRFALLGATSAAALATAAPARADDKPDDKKDDTAEVGLGLAPGSPQVGTLPGGIQP